MAGKLWRTFDQEDIDSILDKIIKLSKNCEDFSNEMKKKLAEKSREKGGWDDPDWDIEDIKNQLIKHVEKGDFVDVANFAMFAWYKSRA